MDLDSILQSMIDSSTNKQGVHLCTEAACVLIELVKMIICKVRTVILLSKVCLKLHVCVFNPYKPSYCFHFAVLFKYNYICCVIFYLHSIYITHQMLEYIFNTNIC